jgi:hypothetical protein
MEEIVRESEMRLTFFPILLQLFLVVVYIYKERT